MVTETDRARTLGVVYNFSMIAERGPIAAVLVATVATVPLLAVGTDHVTPRPTLAPVVEPRITRATCPPHVRDAIRLGDDVSMLCARGRFGESATFVIAYYKTTEWWERLAVVGDDGQLIVPLTDRPSLPRWQIGDVSKLELADLDGDGIDEAVTWYTGATRRAEVIGVAHGALSFAVLR